MRFASFTCSLLLYAAACSSSGGNSVDPMKSTVALDRGTGVVADGVDHAGITVTILDQGGDPMPGVVVHFAATGTGNTLTGDVTTDALGQAVATLASTRAEGKMLTISVVDPAVTLATQPNVQFVAGPASQLLYTVPPSSTMAGMPMTPAVQVTAADAQGNPATDFTGAITLMFAEGPGGAVPSGTPSVNAVAGVATFANLIATQAFAGYKLIASTPAFVASVTSTPFTVSPGPPSKLAFGGPDKLLAVAGTPLTVTVSLLDAFDNIITSGTDAVTIAIATGGGNLSGTATASAVGGIATFSAISLDKAGAHTLAATAAGYAGATSVSFSIEAAAAAKLAFVSAAPTGKTSSAAGLPADASTLPEVKVEVQDAFGNLNTGATSLITLAIGTNPGTATLVGGAPKAAVAGVASFTDVQLDKGGNGYTLAATSGNLSMGTSAAFDLKHTVVAGNGGLTFVPAALTVKVGETVHWYWASANHTVASGTSPTYDNKFCFPAATPCSDQLAALGVVGSTFDFTPTVAGAYPYFCKPHAAQMNGTITAN